jgi:clan AA aspartic protease
MGDVFADLLLRADRRSVKKRLLIDTGSTFSWIDRTSLERLGVKPVDIRRFSTIDGRIIEREVGEVEVKALGRKAHTIVVFAEEEEAEVLGLHALEGLSLEVDPINRELKKVSCVKAV